MRRTLEKICSLIRWTTNQSVRLLSMTGDIYNSSWQSPDCVASCRKRSLWSDCAFAQSDQSFRYGTYHKTPFFPSRQGNIGHVAEKRYFRTSVGVKASFAHPIYDQRLRCALHSPLVQGLIRWKVKADQPLASSYEASASDIKRPIGCKDETAFLPGYRFFICLFACIKPAIQRIKGENCWLNMLSCWHCLIHIYTSICEFKYYLLLCFFFLQTRKGILQSGPLW